MRKFSLIILNLLLFSSVYGEQFRTQLAATMDFQISSELSAQAGFNDAVLIKAPADLRFVRGIELELSCPQAYLRNKGSLALAFYLIANREYGLGTVDIQAPRLFIQTLPGRLKNVYQLPLRAAHGFRGTPYVNLPFDWQGSGDYLLRIMPIAKGFEDGIEDWRFNIKGKIVWADEGAVALKVRYPQGLEERAFSVMVNDEPAQLSDGLIVLKTGEHQISLYSEDFRTEHRLVNIVPGKIQNLEILLRSSAPLIFIEAPENVQVFFDGVEVESGPEGLVSTAGEHEIIFTIGNYTLRRNLTTRLGMSYEVNLLVDVQINEKE